MDYNLRYQVTDLIYGNKNMVTWPNLVQLHVIPNHTFLGMIWWHIRPVEWNYY